LNRAKNVKKTFHNKGNNEEFKNFFEYFLYDFAFLAKFLNNSLDKAVKEETQNRLEIYGLDDKVELLNLKDKLLVILDFQGISNDGKVFAEIRNGVLRVSAWREDVRYYREIPLSRDFCIENVSLRNGVVTITLKRRSS